MVGDWRDAIPCLRTSFDHREARLIGLKAGIFFQPIRHRPEYRQLLAEIGFPVE